MQLEVRIVDLLDASSELRSDLSKRLLVGRTARYAGYSLQVVEHPIARQWLLELVEECARSSSSLSALSRAVKTLAPGAPLCDELARLVDEWEATETEAAAAAPSAGRGERIDSEAARAWPALKSELGRLDPVDVDVPYRLATGERELEPPSHCVTAWQVFVHIVGQGAGPSGLPPFMIFLEYLILSGVLSPDTERLTDLWNRRLAVEHGLAAQLDGVRQQKAVSVRNRSPIHLVIQIEPAGNGGDRFHVSWWRQWYSSSTRNVTQDGRREYVERDDLERVAGDIVQETETSLAASKSDLSLEFVLPFELIGIPVEWWLKPEVYGAPKPLAMDYSVTLRSLDRMQLKEWHRVWHHRWQHVELPAATVTHWSAPTGPGHAARLEAQLQADKRLVALVLSEPPDLGGPGMDEVIVALRSGLPAVIWSRSGTRGPDVEDSLRGYVVEGRAADLPARARHLRLAAQQLEPHQQHAHIGRRLALLWDDPERQSGGAPPSPDLQERRGIGP